MHLTVSIAEYGWHPGAWRLAHPAPPALKPLAAMARTAEQAGIDMVLLGLPTVPETYAAHPAATRIHLDPLPLLGALIAGTNGIGLAAFWPTDMAEPFHVARVLASLDHLSGGRTGWIVGRLPPERLRTHFAYASRRTAEERRQRTQEFIDVTRQLWDSWEDAGFVMDQASGLFVDPDRVHPILHEGPHFTVRGPLNAPRPVQGQPVILYAESGDGASRIAAAPSAEIVLAASECILDGRALRATWRDAVTRAGRNPQDVRLVQSVMPILAATPAQAASRAERLDAASALPADAIATPAQRFVGTPAGLAAMMMAWIESGACDGFNILPAAKPDLPWLTDHVMPLLHEQGLRPPQARAGTLRARLGLRRPISRFAA